MLISSMLITAAFGLVDRQRTGELGANVSQNALNLSLPGVPAARMHHVNPHNSHFHSKIHQFCKIKVMKYFPNLQHHLNQFTLTNVYRNFYT